MLVRINGKTQTVHQPATLTDIIKLQGYEGDFFAVALNRICVPRSRYAVTVVNENDEIEILSPMQGG
jgi:sulfur carrier protein